MPAVSGPHAHTGTGMLASLNVLLKRHAAEPSADLAEQISSMTDTMNGWEQPAKHSAAFHGNFLPSRLECE